MNQETATVLKPVKTILVSQPKTERSPYAILEEKYGIKVDFRPFIHVEGVDNREFRKLRINLNEFQGVIFTSRTSVDHYFRLMDELRCKVSMETKYFCISEQIAKYLHKYIVYRKRKIFYGERKIEELKDALIKHKSAQPYLLPCSNLGSQDVVSFLEENDINFQEALMYQTVSSDLSDLADITYDVLVFFSPQGIDSLFENFPQFKQNDTRIAAFGKATINAVLEKGLTINITPNEEAKSMTDALDLYIKAANR